MEKTHRFIRFSVLFRLFLVEFAKLWLHRSYTFCGISERYSVLRTSLAAVDPFMVSCWWEPFYWVSWNKTELNHILFFNGCYRALFLPTLFSMQLRFRLPRILLNSRDDVEILVDEAILIDGGGPAPCLAGYSLTQACYFSAWPNPFLPSLSKIWPTVFFLYVNEWESGPRI